MDRSNEDGGAGETNEAFAAHGYPIDATGAVLTTRLLHSMCRDGINKGIVTLCIGGSQGIARALESVK